jgi:DNA repair and recombination protein RAD52
VDYVEEDAVTRKVSLGLSVIVRVTLRDGTYHEDIGYGEMENCKGKGAAFHKAKKEATTDALKRALRNFGNVLGNCIYDKAYLTKVMKVKPTSPKWDVDALHRHSDYAPVKKDAHIPTEEGIKQSGSSDLKKSISDGSSTETTTDALAVGGFLDADFDGK